MEIFYLDISEFCCLYLFERNSGEFISEPHISLECLLLIDMKIFITRAMVSGFFFAKLSKCPKLSHHDVIDLSKGAAAIKGLF